MGGRGQFKTSSDNGWNSFGGYMNAKIQKLENQFSAMSDQIEQVSTIFKDVSIYVNGYTLPGKEELKILMAKHGGKFHNYYSSSSTTHVIASNLPRAKIKNLKSNHTVVKPEWIVDSIQENKLLPILPYLVVKRTETNQETLQKFVDLPFTGNDSSSNDNPTTSINQARSVGNEEQAKISNGIVPTSNSSFLSDFYSHSRLHFLSTWKAELIDYVRSLTATAPSSFQGESELLKIAPVTNGARLHLNFEKIIAHIDMDCFFVSVGLLSRPHLQDKPVAVTHHHNSTPSVHLKRPGTDVDYERNYYEGKSRKQNDGKKTSSASSSKSSGSDYNPSFSEIASCNYKAREAGLKNGMLYGKAKQLCPELVAIPYDFDAYRQTSQLLYDVLLSYTTNIEAVSCDEALLDITSLVANTGHSPTTVIEHIRNRIREKTGCNASAGIGPNIILARMATRIGKPNGQHQVVADQARSFMRDQPVRSLPSVGYATANKLESLGIHTCEELQNTSLAILKKELGEKTGEKLRNYSNGVDTRKVNPCKERKSVSADVNYGIRLSHHDELTTFIGNLAKEVSERLKKSQLKGKKIALKVMTRKPDAPIDTAKFGGHGVCDSSSRSKNLDSFTDDSCLIQNEVMRLIKSMQINISDLRGIGIQVTQLSSASLVKSSFKSTIENFVKQKENSPGQCESFAEELEDEASDFRPTREQVNRVHFSPRPATKTSTPVAVRKPLSPQCEISSSFLAALPDDIRREVQQDWKSQQRILNRAKHEPQTESRTIALSRSPKRGSKPPSRKSSPVKRKRAAVNVKSNTSPTKITDLFPVLSKATDKSTTATEAPRPTLIDDEAGNSKEEDPVAAPVSIQDSSPSLGGARTIAESRAAVRQWTSTFTAGQPEVDDAQEVSRYLTRLVRESHDIEGACSVLHTLRRSLSTLIDNLDHIDTQSNVDLQVRSWKTMYNQIASTLTGVVKDMYDGALLNVKFLA